MWPGLPTPRHSLSVLKTVGSTTQRWCDETDFDCGFDRLNLRLKMVELSESQVHLLLTPSSGTPNSRNRHYTFFLLPCTVYGLWEGKESPRHRSTRVSTSPPLTLSKTGLLSPRTRERHRWIDTFLFPRPTPGRLRPDPGQVSYLSTTPPLPGNKEPQNDVFDVKKLPQDGRLLWRCETSQNSPSRDGLLP